MRRVLCLLTLVMTVTLVHAQRGQDFASKYIGLCKGDSSIQCVTVSPKMVEQLLKSGDYDNNESIKEALRLAGINRVVAVMNPKTGIEESHPIYEVASSTLARRSFLANLSMNITPELISKLTGHAESNSKTKNI